MYIVKIYLKVRKIGFILIDARKLKKIIAYLIDKEYFCDKPFLDRYDPTFFSFSISFASSLLRLPWYQGG